MGSMDVTFTATVLSRCGAQMASTDRTTEAYAIFILFYF
jgi:hypothetical protein